MAEHRRILSVLVSLILVFCFVASFLTVVHFSDHDCCGKECHICAFINSVMEFFLRKNPAAAFISLLMLAVLSVIIITRADTDGINIFTPVILKVKLSN